jgi:seryl-tRNA(Sec) selenium transferase
LRLAGATPVLAGTAEVCTLADLEAALADDDVACLLLVSSRLVRGEAVDLSEAVAAAHRRGIPAIIDGAGQDLRIQDLLATGADLVLVGPHKYMAAPTAGLIIGQKELVSAIRAHEKGIGRTMKPTKEGILGALAALEERQQLDLDAWRDEQEAKVAGFCARANGIPGILAAPIPDPTGLPFTRVCLTVDPEQAGLDARDLSRAIRSGTPSIWVMEHRAAAQQLVLELVPLREDELHVILKQLADFLD